MRARAIFMHPPACRPQQGRDFIGDAAFRERDPGNPGQMQEQLPQALDLCTGEWHGKFRFSFKRKEIFVSAK